MKKVLLYIFRCRIIFRGYFFICLQKFDKNSYKVKAFEILRNTDCAWRLTWEDWLIFGEKKCVQERDIASHIVLRSVNSAIHALHALFAKTGCTAFVICLIRCLVCFHGQFNMRLLKTLNLRKFITNHPFALPSYTLQREFCMPDMVLLHRKTFMPNFSWFLLRF